MFYENIKSQKELNLEQIRFIRSLCCETEHITDEQNNSFWELFYVQNGSINIYNDSTLHTISKSCFFFRQPDETLTFAPADSAPVEIINIGFDCNCAAMDSLPAHSISSSPIERQLLYQIIQEAKPENHAAFASGQLTLLYLQLLLIHLIRGERSEVPATALPFPKHLWHEDELFHSIVAYMEENIQTQLTIDRICRDNLIGRGLLQKIFSDYAGCGIIDYFSLMKINAAKQLIRENQMNFSQIAEHLGYSSIHYFSRQFKKITGTTPSAYAASVRIP